MALPKSVAGVLGKITAVAAANVHGRTFLELRAPQAVSGIVFAEVLCVADIALQLFGAVAVRIAYITIVTDFASCGVTIFAIVWARSVAGGVFAPASRATPVARGICGTVVRVDGPFTR